MGVKLLLVSAEGASFDAYHEALTKLDVAYDRVDSLAAVAGPIAETQYNGLLLDDQTVTQADPDARDLIQQLLQIFPTIRLKWEPEKYRIRSFFIGEF